MRIIQGIRYDSREFARAPTLGAAYPKVRPDRASRSLTLARGAWLVRSYGWLALFFVIHSFRDQDPQGNHVESSPIAQRICSGS